MIMSLTGIGLMLGNWVSLAALALIPTVGLVSGSTPRSGCCSAPSASPIGILVTRSRLVPGIW